jgi:site-specific DNA recombinase
MICAIYARKSTEQTGVADEAKSVTRQVEHARAYAAQKGWTVDEVHVYSDDGVSGALFGAHRPALARLLNALKPRPPFQVLLMSEETRLGREQIETAYVLKQITDAGVRVFFYLEDRERTLDTALEKVMLSLTGFAAEMEREKTRLRTHDALARKARAGHVTGGAVFGYRNRPVLDGERRAYVERLIDPQEASVVRRIFEMAAAGTGFKRIGMALNEEGAIAPAPRRHGRPRGWAPSTVRDVIYRDLYRGVLVWNRRQKLVRQGAKTLRQRAQRDWLTVPVPALQIVSDELWQAAHARLAASRATYFSATGGRAWGRPANGIESPYLLTGLASCGACGGSIFVHSHDHRRHRRFFYACMTYHLRGRAVCKNNLEVPMEFTDQAVLTAVERDVLRVEVLETSLAKAMDTLRPGLEVLEERERALRDELARLEAEVGRLAAAIATGGELAALVAALQERERRRAQGRTELAALERTASRRDGGDMLRILDQLRGHLTDWQDMLRQEPPAARGTLRALLNGRFIFTPRGDGDERYYEFEGTGTVSRIIAGLALPKGVVTPAGFEPAISTLKGSRPWPG